MSNIFIIGPTGVGKTTIAEQLAEHRQQAAHDSDALVSERAGMTVADIFAQRGENAFRQAEEEAVDELTKKQGVVVAIGAGAVLSRKTRLCLKERGKTIYLRARPETLQKRLDQAQVRAVRPLLRHKPLLATLKKMHEERSALYDEAADVRLDVDSLSPEQALTKILKQLENYHD